MHLIFCQMHFSYFFFFFKCWKHSSFVKCVQHFSFCQMFCSVLWNVFDMLILSNACGFSFCQMLLAFEFLSNDLVISDFVKSFHHFTIFVSFTKMYFRGRQLSLFMKAIILVQNHFSLFIPSPQLTCQGPKYSNLCEQICCEKKYFNLMPNVKIRCKSDNFDAKPLSPVYPSHHLALTCGGENICSSQFEHMHHHHQACTMHNHLITGSRDISHYFSLSY